MKLYTVGPIEGNLDELEEQLVTQTQSIKEVPQLTILYVPFEAEHQQYLERIKKILPCPLIGATSGGACFTERGFTLNGCVVGILAGDFTVDIAVADSLKEDADTTVPRALGALNLPNAQSGGRAILTFADAFGTDGEKLAQLISDNVPKDYFHFGGTAGDNLKLKASKIFVEQQVLSDAVVCVSIVTPDVPQLSALHGWQPIDSRTSHMVTHIDGHRLKKLDGMPALKCIERTLTRLKILKKGDDLKQIMIGYKLGVKRPFGEGLKIRSVRGIEDDGSLILASSLSKGDVVRLVKAEGDDLISAAKTIGEQTCEPGIPQAHLVFDCAARLKMLGPRYEEEVQAICGKNEHPVLGLACFGEFAKQGRVVEGFHNATTVSAVWR